MPLPTLPPTPTDVTPSGDYARAQAWSMLLAKNQDAGNWATWAATLLNSDIADINNLLGSDIVGQNITDLAAALSAIQLYTPSGSFTYTAPTAPTYDTVPTYVAQTLGTILDIPAVNAITVDPAPSTSMTFTNSDFTDTLLSDLKTRLSADINAYSTGLGSTVEAAMFARETARVTAERAIAYNEITTSFSSRGFDMPPGALLAKQTEMNNETSKRLTDSSGKILEESARLALDYNKHIVSVSSQLVEALSRVFDSKVVRDFEAEKTRVTLAIEGFKQEVAVALAKADINKTEITSTVAANEGTVKVFQAQIEGQIAPIKAIADSNQAKASAYGAEVQAATADLNAQVVPEELKLKGVDVNARIAATKADVAINQARLSIETAARQMALEVETLRGLAQSAQQMVASSLGSINTSTGFSFGGSASTRYDGNVTDGHIAKSEQTVINK